MEHLSFGFQKKTFNMLGVARDVARDFEEEKKVLKIIKESLFAKYDTEREENNRKLIKTLFKRRDFQTLFKDESLLYTYALEYLGGRSLCYRRVCLEMIPVGRDIRRIVCLGAGNGAELMGLSPILLRSNSSSLVEEKIKITIHDLSLYGDVLDKLWNGLAMDCRPNQLELEKITCDLLDTKNIASSGLLAALSAAHLITANFLLNEIMTASKTAFVGLITTLVKAMKKGSYLLVLDPASDFSEIALEKNSNAVTASATYMLFHLLDAIQAFERVEYTDSCWYRFNPDLQDEFPIKLQNMRYYLRLYKKV